MGKAQGLSTPSEVLYCLCMLKSPQEFPGLFQNAETECVHVTFLNCDLFKKC